MQRLGYIHDMMDVKVLILFVMAGANYPMTAMEIYEVCYQDDCLSYFDVCTALPEMVKSGHVSEVEEGEYQITEKGRSDGILTEDSIAFTVKQRAQSAIERFNHRVRRSSLVKTKVLTRSSGDVSIFMSLDDDMGNLMTMELFAPDERQGARLARLFEKKAEMVYNLVMQELLSDEDELEA